MATQMVVQVVPQQMVVVPQQMVVVKPPGQVRYPGESSMVGKYGGGTFACFDDIESYVVLDDIDERMFHDDHDECLVTTSEYDGLNRLSANRAINILGRNEESQKKHDEYMAALRMFI